MIIEGKLLKHAEEMFTVFKWVLMPFFFIFFDRSGSFQNGPDLKEAQSGLQQRQILQNNRLSSSQQKNIHKVKGKLNKDYHQTHHKPTVQFACIVLLKTNRRLFRKVPSRDSRDGSTQKKGSVR